MDTATIREHFMPPQPAKAPEQPTLSERIMGLFGKVQDRQRKKQEQNAATFSGLVELVARHEITGQGKLPSPDEVVAILEADDKTTDDLAKAVDRLTKIARLQEELKGESDAALALSETREAIDNENRRFEQLAAAHKSRIDQLNAERRERSSRVDQFTRLRSQLHQLAPDDPNPRLVELVELIRETHRQEMALRAQAGRVALPEKYIAMPQEHFRAELDEAEAKLEKRLPTSPNVSPGPRVLEEMQRVEELRRRWPEDQRLCKLGEQVRAVRQRRAELVAERDQLERERVAALESNSVLSTGRRAVS